MMACRFEYNGKTYDQDGLAKALEQMPPHEAHKYIPGVQNLPNAPFKKSWHELALKRMIREAAEKGYDRLSWTPGEAQAARYDLSAQVGKLRAIPFMDQTGLKYEIKGWKPNSDKHDSPAFNKIATEEELPNIVGKEMAKKIIDRLEGKKAADFEGLDLKIGGEGMKGFYDQIIPKALEKISGEKVKISNINTPITNPKIREQLIRELMEEEEHPRNVAEHLVDQELNNGTKNNSGKQSIHYIDLPQSLKDKALGKGFPLFSSTHIFTPVSHNPFQQDKK